VLKSFEPKLSAVATIAVSVCATFTVTSRQALAGPASSDYIENPYLAHKTDGSMFRAGSIVQEVYSEHQNIMALGGTMALGRRLSRFTFEAEYGYVHYQDTSNDTLALGHGHRIGANARFDVVRLGSNIMGPNSMLAVFVELGVGKTWNSWLAPVADSRTRMMQSDNQRFEQTAGVGIMLDHRLQEPIGFPRRVAWFLGWRAAFAPHDSEPVAVCKGVVCKPVTTTEPTSKLVDTSIALQSSLAFTF
jgi:hypothetical protein